MCASEKETSSDKEKKDDENNVVLTNEQMVLLEDQRQELADLRRQVVFLQVSQSSRQLFDSFPLAFYSQAMRETTSKLNQILRNRFIDFYLPQVLFCFQIN